MTCNAPVFIVYIGYIVRYDRAHICCVRALPNTAWAGLSGSMTENTIPPQPSFPLWRFSGDASKAKGAFLTAARSRHPGWATVSCWRLCTVFMDFTPISNSISEFKILKGNWLWCQHCSPDLVSSQRSDNLHIWIWTWNCGLSQTIKKELAMDLLGEFDSPKCLCHL